MAELGSVLLSHALSLNIIFDICLSLWDLAVSRQLVGSIGAKKLSFEPIFDDLDDDDDDNDDDDHDYDHDENFYEGDEYDDLSSPVRREMSD